MSEAGPRNVVVVLLDSLNRHLIGSNHVCSLLLSNDRCSSVTFQLLPILRR